MHKRVGEHGAPILQHAVIFLMSFVGIILLDLLLVGPCNNDSSPVRQQSPSPALADPFCASHAPHSWLKTSRPPASHALHRPASSMASVYYPHNGTYFEAPAFVTAASSRIAIVSLNAPGHTLHRRSVTWMFPFTITNRIAYAKKHQYALHVEGAEVVDARTPASWSKVKLIRKYLLLYEYVLWVDIDVLFLTMSKGIDELIAMNPNADVVMTKDFNGINCGVMLWRRSHWSLDFLDRMWFFDGNRNDIWQEQHAMSTLMRNPADADHVVLIPQRMLNAYTYNTPERSAWWQEGDLLVHLANCDGRPHDCWNEFKHYYKIASEINGIPAIDHNSLWQTEQQQRYHIW